MLPIQDTREEWLKFLQVQPSTESTPIKPLEYDALLNTLRGTTKVAVMHQQQQQQQQMQQQQQQQQFVSENIEENAARMKRAKELLATEKPKIVGSEDISDSLDIMGGSLSLSNTPLRNAITEKTKKIPPKKILDALLKIRSSFAAFAIMNISTAALNKIIDNLDYFVDGIAYDNLPAGFFIASNELKFDQAAFTAASQTSSDGYSQPPILSGGISAEEETHYRSVTQKSLEKKLSSSESSLPPLDVNILEKLGFTEDNRKALAPVLDTPPDGAIKTYALLDTLRKLQKEDPTLYESVKKCFIDKSKNLSEVANLETLKTIQEISKFSPAQKAWWCNLTEQHTNDTNGIGKSNLVDLYNTFDAFYKDLNKFWIEVYGSKLELPYPCPLSSIGNMQVALNRAAYIIKHASNPKDQLQNLQEINLQTAQIFSIGDAVPPLRFVNSYVATQQIKNLLKYYFFEKLYSDTQEDLYFPSFFAAKTFLNHLSEQMHSHLDTITDEDGSITPYIESIRSSVVSLAANMLQHKVQTGDAFQCLDVILLCINKNLKTLTTSGDTGKIRMLLKNYPIFVNEKGVLQPNPKHFELALKNSTAGADIFHCTEESFKQKKQADEQLPKSDILTCLLSIKLEATIIGTQNPEQVQTVIDKFYELYKLKPEAIAILASILSNTDFGNEDNLATKEQLYQIIEKCKTIDPPPPDYKAIHDLVVATCPTVKFLPDPEYAKACAKEAPKDLNAIIKLFEPLFGSFGIAVNSEALLSTAAELLRHEDKPIIGGFIKTQREHFQSEKPDDIITGLLLLMQKARDSLAIKLAAKSAGRKSVTEELTAIKNEQLQNVEKLLKSLNFSPESIAILTESINDIDLTVGDDLIPKLEKLVAITAWTKDFATNYGGLIDLKKWEDSSKNFLTLVNANFAKVKENINGLLSIYTTPYRQLEPKPPRLLDNAIFCSPEQLLQKILNLSPTKKLEPTHIPLLQKIAEKQASSNPPIPLAQLDSLLDITLQFPDQADLLTDLAFNKEQYGDFPIVAFLSFAKNLTEGELTAAITDLKSFFDKTIELADKNALSSFLGVLLKSDALVKDNALRYDYLKKIHQDFDLTKQEAVFKIVEQILAQEKISTPEEQNLAHANIFQLIARLKYLLNDADGEALFTKIIKLYEQRPCPNSEQLLAMLAQEKNMEKFIAEFETAPYGDRDNQKNQDGKINKHFTGEQFATDKVNQIIVGLSKNNPNLSGEFLQELKADFNYINAIGNNHTFPGTDPSKPARQMSQKEIREHIKKCQDSIQDPSKTEAERYLAKLHSIALLRETMYRTTGKMPNSTQILSVLLQTKNKDNICMQINTGEGKSITNPLLAAMQHLEGYAVNVFTSNTLLATRDREEASNFWGYLGVRTSFISKGSRHENYIEDGINYTTPADFALYSAAVGDQSIGQGPMGMAGVYDESDLAFYETNTDYNFSDSIDKENTDPYKNPYEMVYPQLNDFVANNQDYKNLSAALKKAGTDVARNEISNKIAVMLRFFLKTENDQQAKALSAVDDNRLLRWLAAAESIKKLVEGKDYIVKPMERDEYGTIKKYRKICLLDGEGHEIEGAILANGAHQLLSARLEQEEKAKGITGNDPFVIDQETFCISSRNAHTELLRMNKVVGITGTLGQDELIDELRKRHPAMAIKVPPHNPNKRQDLRPIFANNAEAHLKLIQKELAKSIKEPQLVIGSDSEQCKDLLEKLKDFAKEKHVTLILAAADGYTQHTWDDTTSTWTTKKLSDDPDAKKEDSVFKQAGEPNTITIATPILGRGVNIPNLKKVIKTTFDPNARLESQVDGRTGRYGAQGVTIGIYDWEQTCRTQHITGNDANLWTDRSKREVLDRIRHKTQAEEINKLNLSSATKGISVQYQNYFDEAVRSTAIPDEKQSFLSKKCMFIEKIALLHAKTFHGQTKEDLEHIAAFNQGVEKIWAEMASQNPTLQLVEISTKYQNYFDAAIRQAEPNKKQALRAAKLEFTNQARTLHTSTLERIRTDILSPTIPPEEQNQRLKELYVKKEDLEKLLSELIGIAIFEQTERYNKEIEKVEAQIKEEEQSIIIKGNIADFNKKITAIWQTATESNTELETAKQQVDNSTAQPTTSSKASYYQIKTSHFFADDTELNTSQYYHQIYAAKKSPLELSVEERKTISDRFESDLDNLSLRISKVRSFPTGAITVGNVQTIIDDYIKPYFELANKLANDDPLKQKFISALSEKITDIKLDSNVKHAYLYAICQAKLTTDNPEIKQYALAEITADKGIIKKEILKALKAYIDDPEHDAKKASILKKILENKPTGDTIVDYYVTLIKKKRGTIINTNAFGDTSTSRLLTTYAKEELEKLKSVPKIDSPPQLSI